GIGFGKSYENNLEVLSHQDRMKQFGLPLVLAASRKSVIGLTLNLPVDQREEGTIVTSVLASVYGWDMVRVHDVEKNVRAVQMMEKIKEFRDIR
ncbi:MAG: dihydropteroate synthase, partial [Lachnospiraceae bacterium]|nr:dihydropteroate synthase [Lachnospiraceae bacterium]